MSESNYDFQQIHNAEPAVKEPVSSPDRLKKLCGKMILAMIVYAIAAAALSTVLNLLVSWIYRSAQVTTQGFGLAWSSLDTILKQVLYFLIPVLFARSACKSFESRVSFLGCFYLQDVIGAIFLGVVNIVKEKVTGFAGGSLLLTSVISAVLFLVAYALEIVVLICLVRHACSLGLFSQENFYHSLYQSKSRKKAPAAAAVCCAAFVVLNMLLSNAVLYLLQNVFNQDSHFISSFFSNVKIIFRLVAVFIFYAVGKSLYKQKSGGLLFTACIIGISVLNCADSLISLIFNGVPGTLALFGIGAPLPLSYIMIVSMLGIVTEAVVAAVLGYLVFKRLNRTKEPAETTVQ